MPSTLQLRCQSLRCDILPHLGGCISGLWLGDIPVLRSAAAHSLTSARQAGSYPLLPFSNRMGHAQLLWDGRCYPLRPTPGDEPHAIHGVGWQRPWRVLDASPRFVRLSYAHQPDDGWPFAFEAEQTLQLSANTLALTLRLENRSGLAVPAGLGWHPYFVKRQRSHMAFEATGRWEMGADKLPTHRTPSSGLTTDCSALQVDHCFDGWNGVVQLRDELLHTRLSSSLNHLVVFTSSQRDFVAIEPVSHVNNAFNLAAGPGADAAALGVRVLQPGESISAGMRIQVAAVDATGSPNEMD